MSVLPSNAEYIEESGSPFSKLLVRLDCASKSTKRTEYPLLASIEPTLATVVVLPTPPLWLATEIIFVVIHQYLNTYKFINILPYFCMQRYEYFEIYGNISI